MENFGARLKSILESEGITQSELSEMAETTGATISRYVNDNRVPTANQLNKIAKALGVSVDYLLRGTERPPTREEILSEMTPEEILRALGIMDKGYIAAITDLMKIAKEKSDGVADEVSTTLVV